MAHMATLFLVVWASQGSVLTDTIPVPGSKNGFAAKVEREIDGRKVPLELTGVAMRKRFLFNVYAIGSYVEEGRLPRSAQDLVLLDAPKQLHLIMERDVSGQDIAENFRSAIRANYPAPEFEQEITTLAKQLSVQTLRKGDQIFLTCVPKVGLHVALAGKAEQTIANPRFCRAVWEIYFGKNNIGAEVKQGLLSRLR
jgi:hypothetical protein